MSELPQQSRERKYLGDGVSILVMTYSNPIVYITQGKISIAFTMHTEATMVNKIITMYH